MQFLSRLKTVVWFSELPVNVVKFILDIRILIQYSMTETSDKAAQRTTPFHSTPTKLDTACWGMNYLQVNALGEWIIGIYLHEFTNNEREISIPHEAASCGIEKFRVHC